MDREHILDIQYNQKIGFWEWKCVCHSVGRVLYKRDLLTLTCKGCGAVWTKETIFANYTSSEYSSYRTRLDILMEG